MYFVGSLEKIFRTISFLVAYNLLNMQGFTNFNLNKKNKKIHVWTTKLNILPCI